MKSLKHIRLFENFDHPLKKKREDILNSKDMFFIATIDEMGWPKGPSGWFIGYKVTPWDVVNVKDPGSREEFFDTREEAQEVFDHLKLQELNDKFKENNAMDNRGQLEKELVPPNGPAKTLEGEFLRAAMKIAYRKFNDGDDYWEGYGVETAGPAAAFLLDTWGGFRDEAYLEYEDYDEAYRELKDMPKSNNVDMEYFLDAVAAGVLLNYNDMTFNNTDMLDEKWRKLAEEKWGAE